MIITFLSFDKRLCYVGHSNCLKVWLLHFRLAVALVDPNTIADKVNSVKKQITDIIKVAEVSPSFIYLFIYLFSHSQNFIQHEQKVLIKL